MDVLLKTISAGRAEGDSVDNFRYFYIPATLTALATFTFASNYVGAPMQCWVPTQFSDGWEKYMETYCLIEGTYYVHMNKTNLPQTESEKVYIAYYQWVPFILIILACFSYAPRLLWKIMQKTMGIDVQSVVSGLRQSTKQMFVKEDLDSGEYRERQRKVLEKNTHSSLSTGIVVHKAASLLAILLALLFLEAFFGLGWALDQTVNLFCGTEWKESAAFPRVTFCDVQVREMGGHVNNWTVQCVLMVNMFNEKIFMCVWWLFVFSFFISIVNLLSWWRYLSDERAQKKLILSVLLSKGVREDALLHEFVECRYRECAVLVQLITSNVSLFAAAFLVLPLWHAFEEERRKSTPPHSVFDGEHDEPYIDQ